MSQKFPTELLTYIVFSVKFVGLPLGAFMNVPSLLKVYAFTFCQSMINVKLLYSVGIQLFLLIFII